MFSLERLPETIPGYKGVHLITSRHYLYEYPRGYPTFKGTAQPLQIALWELVRSLRGRKVIS